MVISDTTSIEEYTGSGITGPYSYPHPFAAIADITVSLDGIEQTLTTNYNVSTTGVDSQTGIFTGANITFTSTVANGVAIRFVRNTPITSELAYNTLTSFDPDKLQTKADRDTLIVQDAARKGDDVVTVGVDQVVTAATPLTVSAATPLVQANIQPSVDAAAASASAANTSASNASTSETNAASSASAANTSASNSATSETNAATSETNAATSASNSATSASNASTSETNALASQNKAQEWATKAEDDPVETSPDQFSSFHWAQKAEEQKDAIIGTLTGDLLSWTTQVGSASPSKGSRLRIDSTDNLTVISLASSPDGDTEYNFTEADNVNWSLNPWTINPNGNNVNGVAGNFTVAGRNPFRVIWKGATDGYEIEYLLQADGRFSSTSGNFTAFNGGKYLIDEGATITLNSVVAGMEIYFQPKADQDLLSTPATISYNGVNTFFGFAEDYVFDDNGTIKLYSDDGTTIQVELTGVSHQNA